jgi:hypothetical protein
MTDISLLNNSLLTASAVICVLYGRRIKLARLSLRITW